MNISLNSYVTEDGLEMGRAQVVQSEACELKPMAYMNPILLKPSGNNKTQVIVNGKVHCMMDSYKYKELNKELKKNVSKYKGNILKNKYAEATERAGIDILYSDGDKGSRIITNRKNAVNDSKVGNASGICKETIDKKHILPHSRIDSFVYAVKPTELYNDWGDFWDPDNKQRDFFTAVYNVYKKFDNEVKEYDDKLKKIKNQRYIK